MFHRIFKENVIIQLIVVVLTAILLWGNAFVHNVAMPAPDSVSPLYHSVYLLLKDAPLLSTILAFALLIVEALLLNNLLSDFNIFQKNSYQTAFWYIILMSSSQDLLTLHPLLFVNLFAIIILLMIFRATSKDESYKEVFTAGLFIALSSLFFFKSSGLVLAFWIFLIILQIYTWREWLIVLIGFAAVYVYLFTYYLYFDDVVAKFDLYRQFFQKISFLPRISEFTQLSGYRIFTASVILFLILISFGKILLIINDKIVHVRKMTLILIWFFLISVLISVFLNHKNLNDIYLALLPISILISYYYYNIKRFLFSELLLLLLMIGIILEKIF